ncbi:MAG: hypothetical protein ACJ74O_06680 [Frankiaceae bacterium]
MPVRLVRARRAPAGLAALMVLAGLLCGCSQGGTAPAATGPAAATAPLPTAPTVPIAPTVPTVPTERSASAPARPSSRPAADQQRRTTGRAVAECARDGATLGYGYGPPYGATICLARGAAVTVALAPSDRAGWARPRLAGSVRAAVRLGAVSATGRGERFVLTARRTGTATVLARLRGPAAPARAWRLTVVVR